MQIGKELFLFLEAVEVIGRERHHVGFDVLAFGSKLAAQFGRAERLDKIGTLHAIFVKGILHCRLSFFIGVGVDHHFGSLGGSRSGFALVGIGTAVIAAADHGSAHTSSKSQFETGHRLHFF